MKLFRADLHIHTCLSPCAGEDMKPKEIVKKSLERGLNIIAVCDHNSMENAEAVMECAEKSGLLVLPGMEICSKEEVHILGIFLSPERARDMQEYVYENLPGENRPDYFGEQKMVDASGRERGSCSRFLLGATFLSISRVVERIGSLGGLAIASHIDRPMFGLISQLGFIPPDLPLDGVEISRAMAPAKARKKIPSIGQLPVITSSDAHYPDCIGTVSTFFLIESPSFREMRLCFCKKGGRKILYE